MKNNPLKSLFLTYAATQSSERQKPDRKETVKAKSKVKDLSQVVEGKVSRAKN